MFTLLHTLCNKILLHYPLLSKTALFNITWFANFLVTLSVLCTLKGVFPKSNWWPSAYYIKKIYHFWLLIPLRNPCQFCVPLLLLDTCPSTSSPGGRACAKLPPFAHKRWLSLCRSAAHAVSLYPPHRASMHREQLCFSALPVCLALTMCKEEPREPPIKRFLYKYWPCIANASFWGL